MGCYINHPTISKEMYLAQNGVELSGRPPWPPPKDQCIIFLVDNGPFTAAGVAYDQHEYDSWVWGQEKCVDSRPVRYFFLDKAKALQYVGVSDAEFLKGIWG